MTLPTDLNSGIFSPASAGVPKYTGNPKTATEYVGTMARLLVPLNNTEFDKYVTRLKAIDPNSAALINAVAVDGTNLKSSNGYIDFLLQSAQHALQEKVDVTELLADNYVAYYYGQAAPIFSYSGILINTKQDDQAVSMFRIYTNMIRGTMLAAQNQIVRLKYDSYSVEGTFNTFQWSLAGDNETFCPFSFSLLVKSIGLPPPVLTPYNTSTFTSGVEVSSSGTKGTVSTTVSSSGTPPVASPSQINALDSRTSILGSLVQLQIVTQTQLKNQNDFVDGRVR